MNTPKVCNNNHCTDKEAWVLLRNVVGVCPCGNKYIQEQTIGIYDKDVYNELEELFHVYKFRIPFQCHGCGRFLGSITIVCDKKEDLLKDWNDAKREGVMPSGLFRN